MYSNIRTNPGRKAKKQKNCRSCCLNKENETAVVCSTSMTKSNFKKMLKRYPEIIPDVKSWSVKDVSIFFVVLGFKAEAPVFEEKEIDGFSLLSMKRNDVTKGLGIKLGPALKIYKHVSTLQSRIDESLCISLSRLRI